LLVSSPAAPLALALAGCPAAPQLLNGAGIATVAVPVRNYRCSRALARAWEKRLEKI